MKDNGYRRDHGLDELTTVWSAGRLFTRQTSTNSVTLTLVRVSLARYTLRYRTYAIRTIESLAINVITAACGFMSDANCCHARTINFQQQSTIIIISAWTPVGRDMISTADWRRTLSSDELCCVLRGCYSILTVTNLARSSRKKLSHRIGTAMTLSDLQGHSPFQMSLFVQQCSSWQDFNGHSASRGPSALAERVVSCWWTCLEDVWSDTRMLFWSKDHVFSFWMQFNCAECDFKR